MTDTQLYLAIGIPSALVALNFLAILWQSRGVNRRIDTLERTMSLRFDALQQSMNARFDRVDAKFAAVIDARLRHLEHR